MDLNLLSHRRQISHLLAQAAACRRLASVARTARGAASLRGVADQYDADAGRIVAPSI